jgi:hypothetical protein
MFFVVRIGQRQFERSFLGAMKMPIDKIRSIRDDRRGVATVEFALWSCFILGLLLVSADFAMFTLYKARLARAVSAASLAAFSSKDNIDTDLVARYVTATAAIPGITPTVEVTCNDHETCVNDNRSCGCISLADGSFSPAGECGAPCPSGGVASYYLTISANVTYHHVIMPNPWLEGAKMNTTAVLRL